MASVQGIPKIVKRYFTTAPIIFPLIGLFHIGIFIYQSISWVGAPVGFMYQLRPVVLAAYTVAWIGACFLRKKYATTYLVLTIILVSFYYLFPEKHIYNSDWQNIFQYLLVQVAHLHDAVSDILLYPLPANILFSFIILFYYRRMQPQRRKTLPVEDLPKSITAN